jgi:hypothetical protein
MLSFTFSDNIGSIVSHVVSGYSEALLALLLIALTRIVIVSAMPTYRH